MKPNQDPRKNPQNPGKEQPRNPNQSEKQRDGYVERNDSYREINR